MYNLFVIPRLPSDELSFASLCSGECGVSGTIGSMFLVMNGLKKRGHDIRAWIVSGQRLLQTEFPVYYNKKDALRDRPSKVIQTMWDNDEILFELNAVGIAPWLWTHVHVSSDVLKQLNEDRYSALITVSDTARLTSLHVKRNKSIARVYNPLNDFWYSEKENSDRRYENRYVAFSGFIGESKGAHRVLMVWPYVRKALPNARLFVIGGQQLYQDHLKTGRFGIAMPEFEEKYLAPIVDEFGNFDKAGIEFTGVLSPLEMRTLYKKCSLGVANLNMVEFTETFCCSAVEMLSTEMPVLSVAAGALPETIGRSGGAVLLDNNGPEQVAYHIVKHLRDPLTLAKMGRSGREYVVDNYNVDRIIDCWERILSAQNSELQKHCGRWMGPRTIRYYIERALRKTRMGDDAFSFVRKMRDCI